MSQHPKPAKYTENIVLYAQDDADSSVLRWIEGLLEMSAAPKPVSPSPEEVYLQIDAEGLALVENSRIVRGDFTKILPRLLPNNLNRELLVKAARLKGITGPLTAVDATAGLGEDSLLLAGAGFQVQMYERNPIIAALLRDALRRASRDPRLAPIVSRMQVHGEDSIALLPQISPPPDVVLLDPMFPDRQKSGLIKKKFQLLHHLEQPCLEEEALLNAAISCGPRRVVIKRPLKGPYLAGAKPSYTLKGKSIRYDCLVVTQRSRNSEQLPR